MHARGVDGDMRQLGYVEELERAAAQRCSQAGYRCRWQRRAAPVHRKPDASRPFEDTGSLFNEAAQIGERLFVRGGLGGR